MSEQPNPQAVLDAAHLESVEEQYFAAQQAAYQERDPEGMGDPPVLPPPRVEALKDATERIRRIAHHKRRIAAIEQAATEMIAPLQAQIDQIRAWAADQKKGPEQRIWLHEQSLIAYYRTNPPTGSKTLKLPGGKIASRDQQPEWVYEDEDALIDELDYLGHSAISQVPKLDKNKFKTSVRVKDGVVFDPATGAALPGVKVVERPPIYKVEVEL